MVNRLLKLAIAIVFFIGDNIHRITCKLIGKQKQPFLIILTYHSVKSSHVANFEKQMNSLLKIGKTISLNNEIIILKSRYNFAVTFDDAYQSALQNAVPILRAKNIPATIFVPTGYMGKSPAWIKNQNHHDASETVASEVQLKALPADLITIGTHTISHIRLTNVDESLAWKEIFESKNTLEKLLNKKVTLFAAPFATLDKKLSNLFIQAGYKRVFLNIPTFPATETNLYIMGRTSVEPTDWPMEFYLKLVGAYQWLPLAITIKNRLLGRNSVLSQ
jgi:peptidoglycan/xylan/chitin deacetylase (PgdA/CDA1 family)